MGYRSKLIHEKTWKSRGIIPLSKEMQMTIFQTEDINYQVLEH